jgi:hypothetical protein
VPHQPDRSLLMGAREPHPRPQAHRVRRVRVAARTMEGALNAAAEACGSALGQDARAARRLIPRYRCNSIEVWECEEAELIAPPPPRPA